MSTIDPKSESPLSEHRRRRFSWRTLLRVAVILCVLAGAAAGVWMAFLSPAARFRHAVAHADRIVVRDGGFDCCGPVDDEAILFQVTDPAEIEEVLANLEMAESRPHCACCGFPGIDFYRGQTRVALTSVQHGDAIRWSGWFCDLRLSQKSQEWLVGWLVKHGVSEKEIEQGNGGPRRGARREKNAGRPS
ncbi:MAG: hypothetical protein ACYC35_14640 [Pirellulales bacterium]